MTVLGTDWIETICSYAESKLRLLNIVVLGILSDKILSQRGQIWWFKSYSYIKIYLCPYMQIETKVIHQYAKFTDQLFFTARFKKRGLPHRETMCKIPHRMLSCSTKETFRLCFDAIETISETLKCWNGTGLWELGYELEIPWASYQIRKIVGAHAPLMPGTFSPPPLVKRSRHAPRHVRDARAVMHAAIAD